MSYSPALRSHAAPSGTGRPISYGDRLYVRLVMGGRTVVEFMISRVNDYSELLGELRRQTRGCRGWARLYVRNVSRGWSMERPLMLYRDAFSPQPAMSRPTPAVRASAGRAVQMAFPWDVH